MTAERTETVQKPYVGVQEGEILNEQGGNRVLYEVRFTEKGFSASVRAYVWAGSRAEAARYPAEMGLHGCIHAVSFRLRSEDAV